jgi:hypothetical protein
MIEQSIKYLDNIIKDYLEMEDIDELDVYALKKDLERLYLELTKISSEL